MESLSLAQAQKIALLSQGLLSQHLTGTPYQKTIQTMATLNYVQIDTISVVQRAHHHIMWSRNPHYQLSHLDKMIQEKEVYEYWSHAASYLPMKNFRFSLPRKSAIKSNQEKHWFDKDLKLMASILEKIRSEGPLMAKDFASDVTKKTGWGSKPTKQALEMLYMQGDLMIAERRNFHKVYDITERVLPNHINTSHPTTTEHAKYLIEHYLSAHGIGQLSEIIYLLKGLKTQVKATLHEMCEEGELMEISVKNERYYTTTQSLDLLDKRLKRKQVKILSPFDNLLIQRARAQRLFDFNYLLECYVPANKRKFGYFCLPILWDGKLVAIVDCKVHKISSCLDIINLYITPSLKEVDDFLPAFEREIKKFALFNEVQTVSDYTIKPLN